MHCIARKCAGTSVRCNVSGQKHVHPTASKSRSEFCSPRDHTRPPFLSFALAMILTMNARRFQRTHPLSAYCVSEPVIDAVCTAYLKQALIARTDLPTYAALVTHDSHSLQKKMTTSCTRTISAESCHIATWTYSRVQKFTPS